MNWKNHDRDPSVRYEADVDLARKNDSHTLLVELAGENAKVLEIGPATGFVSKVLTQRGCSVTGIEKDPVAAAQASRFCARMIEGDIEQLDLTDLLGEERFDVVMFGDVLEHLQDPKTVLKKIQPFLATDGKAVASIPNVAHGSIRLALLRGRFDYTDTGLLDRSHLRFFTRRSIAQLFDEAGYVIEHWDETIEDPLATDLGKQSLDVPDSVVEAIRSDPLARVYQFVVAAVPKGDEPTTSEVADSGGRVVAALQALDSSTAMLESELERRDHELLAVHHELSNVVNSVGFTMLAKVRKMIRAVAPWGTRRGGFFLAVSRAIKILITEGPIPLLKRIPQWRLWGPRLLQSAPAGSTLDDQYQDWLQRHALTHFRRSEIERTIGTFTHAPLISVLLPAHNTEPRWIEAAVRSILSQLYENWELCVVDDASTRAETRSVLQRLADEDPRIKVATNPTNLGISGATQRALDLADGEFIALLDHDDELKPDALYEVVRLLNEQPDLDYIYTDEDRREQEGPLVDPFFKPDWSPDMFLCLNYVTHLSVLRTSLVREVGGFRPGFDGAQDWDLQLRIAERTARIGHVPLPLYTWRKIPGSVATTSAAKPYAYEAAERALTDAIRRRKWDARVEPGYTKGYYRIRYAISNPPRVSIIIPTKDQVDVLKRCVQSIEAKTDYPNYEIVIVDNGSREATSAEFLRNFPGTVIRNDGPFNFSALNNDAVARTKGELVLFLNNDTEVRDKGWLAAMVEHAQRPEVGAVGARLYFPDGTVQHEGVLVGPGRGLAGHLDHGGYYKLGDVVRNMSAVTAACMLTKRETFKSVGGFDEDLAVAYNDIDFCLKLREKGLLIVYTPYARLYHHEGRTRGKVIPADDAALFRKRWNADGIYADPYYNPNLSLRYPFTIKTAEEEGEDS